jgi:predicted DNA-binding transcriptional regulator AlpA
MQPVSAVRPAAPLRLRDGEEIAMSAELLDKAEVLRLFGGSKPINASTLYRGIRGGRYPRPIKVGPQSSRWLRDEVEAVLRGMEEARR